ncbi:MAG: hypothetical protein ABSB32_12295 [Thermodesulfobacteriota bacterium]|jgi:hypothetical protein
MGIGVGFRQENLDVLTVIYRDHIEGWLKIKKAPRKESFRLYPRIPD